MGDFSDPNFTQQEPNDASALEDDCILEGNDDVVVESIPGGFDDELFEDQFLIDGDGPDVSNGSDSCRGPDVVPSRIIDALPDMSQSTWPEAEDSTCCVASHRIGESQALIAVGSVDETLRVYLYDPITQTTVLSQTLHEPSDSVVATAFSYDGRYLAAASYDSKVYVYEVSEVLLRQNGIKGSTDAGGLTDSLTELLCRCIHPLEGPGLDVEWLAWHPRGYALAAGSKDATVWMWMASTGSVMNVFTGHAGPVSCGTFAHNGRLLVTGGADGHVIVWNPKTAERIVSFHQSAFKGNSTHTAEPVTCLAVHPTEPLVAAGSEDKGIRVINVATQKLIGTLWGHEDSIESLAFSVPYGTAVPNNGNAAPACDSLLASGGLDGTVHVWDCHRMQSLMRFSHTDLVSASNSKAEDPSNPPIEGMAGPYPTKGPVVGGVTRVHWVPAASSDAAPMLISSSTDCTLRLWNLRERCCVGVLTGHQDTVLDITCFRLSAKTGSVPTGTVARDGSPLIVVSGSDDRTTKVWHVQLD